MFTATLLVCFLTGKLKPIAGYGVLLFIDAFPVPNSVHRFLWGATRMQSDISPLVVDLIRQLTACTVDRCCMAVSSLFAAFISSSSIPSLSFLLIGRREKKDRFVFSWGTIGESTFGASCCHGSARSVMKMPYNLHLYLLTNGAFMPLGQEQAPPAPSHNRRPVYMSLLFYKGGGLETGSRSCAGRSGRWRAGQELGDLSR